VLLAQLDSSAPMENTMERTSVLLAITVTLELTPLMKSITSVLWVTTALKELFYLLNALMVSSQN
jgi:hypothetical protein